jgi:hypothetical protein
MLPIDIATRHELMGGSNLTRAEANANENCHIIFQVCHCPDSSFGCKVKGRFLSREDQIPLSLTWAHFLKTVRTNWRIDINDGAAIRSMLRQVGRPLAHRIRDLTQRESDRLELMTYSEEWGRDARSSEQH